jgi:putative oxidoreductase
MSALPADSLRRQWLGGVLLRFTLAGLIAAHGVARLGFDAVRPFGGWLTAQGWPAGHALAMGITALEIVGPLLLVLGRWIQPLCVAFAVLYAMGIVLVHAQAGWFVVGLGRNGSEYSVLLIVCLLLVALQTPASSWSAPSTAPNP